MATNENQTLELIYIRNEFYKKKFHFALGILLLCVVGIMSLSGMLVYLIKHPPHALYFVANPVGQLIPDPSVKEANMSQDDIIKWVVEAIQNSYSYSFINYRKDFQSAQKYFTDYGWKNYMKGLSASNNLKGIIDRKWIAISRVVDTPKLVGEGTVGGAHAWKYRFPMLVTFLMPPYDDTSKTSNVWIVTVLVQRQNLLTSYKGLGIIQTIAEAAPTNMPAPTLNPAPPGS